MNQNITVYLPRNASLKIEKIKKLKIATFSYANFFRMPTYRCAGIVRRDAVLAWPPLPRGRARLELPGKTRKLQTTVFTVRCLIT